MRIVAILMSVGQSHSRGLDPWGGGRNPKEAGGRKPQIIHLFGLFHSGEMGTPSPGAGRFN